MTKPPRPLRDGRRLDELILHAPLGQTLAAQGSATTNWRRYGTRWARWTGWASNWAGRHRACSQRWPNLLTDPALTLGLSL